MPFKGWQNSIIRDPPHRIFMFISIFQNFATDIRCSFSVFIINYYEAGTNHLPTGSPDTCYIDKYVLYSLSTLPNKKPTQPAPHTRTAFGFTQV